MAGLIEAAHTHTALRLHLVSRPEELSQAGPLPAKLFLTMFN